MPAPRSSESRSSVLASSPHAAPLSSNANPSFSTSLSATVGALALAVVALAGTLAVTVPVAAVDGTSCGVVGIDAIGHAKLQELQSTPGLTTWAELDDRLFACGPNGALEVLEARAGQALAPRWAGLTEDDLFALHAAHPGHVPATSADRLTTSGPWTVLAARDDASRQALRFALQKGELTESPEDVSSGAATGAHAGHGHAASVQSLGTGRVLARQSANRPARARAAFGPDVEQVVDAVDGTRWLADVTTLAGWNRWTRGSEIDQARDWLLQEMTAIGLADVHTERFQVGGDDADNVLGRLVGSVRPEDLLIVGGHYDSTSENPSSAAPGAEDNASGCAGVLALARALAPFGTEATVIFVCYSGEEQGLHGSSFHSNQIVAANLDGDVDLMLNMDMIGYTGDADLDVLLETDGAFPTLPDDFEDAAVQYTTLRPVISFFAFGSDHVPFLNDGMPALLTIENDWASFPNYHRTTDLPDGVDFDMGYQTLRMNAAVLAHRAGVLDPGLVFADGFESGTAGAWIESDEP